jgi:hypothetical protein
MSAKNPSLTGKIIFQYFYDVGGDIELDKILQRKLSIIEHPRMRGKRILAPKYEAIGLQPLDVDLGVKEVNGKTLTIGGHIFPIGTIAIYLTLDFKEIGFEKAIELSGLNECMVKVDGKELDFDEIPLKFFQELRKTIEPALIFPYPPYKNPEIYTITVLSDSKPKLKAKDLLTQYKKQVAGLLRSESEWKEFSDKEVEDALKAYLTYSKDDIIFIDWYSALISGAMEYSDELIRMLEIAKIQLLEIKTYDALLDRRMEGTYASLRAAFAEPKMGIAWGSKTYNKLSRASSELAELRVEITSLLEDLRNVLKFTGEWYLGKLYRMASEKFRIGDWLSLVDKKLDRLQELYSMAMERVDVQRANTLEILIIIVIVLEVVFFMVTGL